MALHKGYSDIFTNLVFEVMDQEIVKYLIEQGMREAAILGFLSVPIILLIVTFFKYVIGIKTLNTYSLIIITYLYYFLGATDPPYMNSNPFIGIVYGILLISTLFFITTGIYNLIRGLHIHYFSKISVVISSTILSIFLLLLISGSIDGYLLMRFDIVIVVLITILSEQFLRQYTKTNFKMALGLVAGSLLVSLFAYWTISLDIVQTMLLTYPWIVIGAVLLNLAVGKYSGLRFLEYFRFYDLLVTDDEQANPDSEE